MDAGRVRPDLSRGLGGSLLGQLQVVDTARAGGMNYLHALRRLI